MIISRISDGFGNQMFMYACGYAVSKRLNTQLILDTSYLATNGLRQYELDKLNIRCEKIFSTTQWKYYPLRVLARKVVHVLWKIRFCQFVENSSYPYDQHIEEITDDTYLKGYWQNERYFNEYRNDILRMYTPCYIQAEGCMKNIAKVCNCESVAVHVRRGDYVKLGICLDWAYYYKAINLVKSKIKNPVFFVFSDDLEYARRIFANYNEEFRYINYSSNNQTLDDFFIMKSCKHIIMANSSYSWWAAWLNDNPDKLVVRPNFSNTVLTYPETWIPVGG